MTQMRRSAFTTIEKADLRSRWKQAGQPVTRLVNLKDQIELLNTVVTIKVANINSALPQLILCLIGFVPCFVLEKPKHVLR